MVRTRRHILFSWIWCICLLFFLTFCIWSVHSYLNILAYKHFLFLFKPWLLLDDATSPESWKKINIRVEKKVNIKKKENERKIYLLKQLIYSRQFPILHGYSENAKQHQFSSFWSPRSPCLAVRKITFKNMEKTQITMTVPNLQKHSYIYWKSLLKVMFKCVKENKSKILGITCFGLEFFFLISVFSLAGNKFLPLLFCLPCQF